MGLSPIMVDKIFEVVNDIHSRGTTILLVEQNASRALQLASRGYVMDSGEVTMSGDAKSCSTTRRCAPLTSANRPARARARERLTIQFSSHESARLHVVTVVSTSLVIPTAVPLIFERLAARSRYRSARS